VTAASSTIGVVIPPSIPMIIFAGLTNASIGALFLGGIIPGVLIGLGMMTFIYILAVKRNYPRDARVEFKAFLKMLKETIPALLTTINIIREIITRFLTATEAADISSLYAAVVCMFYYKTLKWKHFPKILFDT